MSTAIAAAGSDPGDPTGHPEDAGLLKATETWFVKRGLPFFIQDYRATDDVFTRAFPVFVAYFVINLMLMLTLRLSAWERVAGAVIGMVVLLGVYAIRNRASKRRAFDKPQRVGFAELALFVVIPPVVALPARMYVHYQGLGRWKVPCIDLAVNVGVIFTIYVVASALLPLARWALRRTFQELGEVFDLAARALPLLFLFNAFLFISKDVWEFAGQMKPPRLWAVVALFALFTVLFLLYRLPDEVQRVAAHDDHETVAEAVAGSPVEAVAERVELHPGKVELDRRQRANVLMVLFVGQMLQVVLLSFLVFVFFLGFGLVTFSADDLREWTNSGPHPLSLFGLGHYVESYLGITIDRSLFQVSIFLAAVSGFFFSVSSLTDDVYKEQFYARMNHELETAIQVRRVYLALYEERHRFDADDFSEGHLWLRLPLFRREDDPARDAAERAEAEDLGTTLTLPFPPQRSTGTGAGIPAAGGAEWTVPGDGNMAIPPQIVTSDPDAL